MVTTINIYMYIYLQHTIYNIQYMTCILLTGDPTEQDASYIDSSPTKKSKRFISSAA